MSSLDSYQQNGAGGESSGERVFSLDDTGASDALARLEAIARRAREKAEQWSMPEEPIDISPAEPLEQLAPYDVTPSSIAEPEPAPVQAQAPAPQPVVEPEPQPVHQYVAPAPQPVVEPTAVAEPEPAPAAAPAPAAEVEEEAGFAAQASTPEADKVVQQRDQQRLRAGLEQSMHPALHECLRLVIERGGSDLHLGVDVAPSFRIDGDLVHLPEQSEPWPHERLHEVVKSILTPEEFKQLVDELELDLAIDYDENYRFRVNLAFDRLGVAAVLRLIPNEVKSLRDLNMPESLYKLADMPRGLVLVTGPTGSGKSTTLAAMIDRVNESRACHILTIEDPIEYVHKAKRAVVNQREVGRDTKSFNEALRRALRQDPDVILVGELRDHETIQVALTAAETGHLVLSTLHTQDSVQTVDRIIDVFPAAQQGQIRTQLAGTLRGVVSQTLLKRVGGGRVAASEILLGTSAVANMIREGKTHLLYTALQAGSQYGMHTLDQNLAELVGTGQVERSEAEVYVKDPQAFRSLRNRISNY
ncbi:type IV pilus twitching motility protein PilT [Pseudoclavibacter soli]|uniref:type IV pilus twitching motility protein PilT n=1 Tax=Pseudoclavibacter soli TaxID=452623 RepID=UPI00040E63B7|nr:type IV pilus twitching motility protein PilT [Pseudoclavibacter soli]